jgi:hypothetical protein
MAAPYLTISIGIIYFGRWESMGGMFGPFGVPPPGLVQKMIVSNAGRRGRTEEDWCDDRY